MGGRFEVDPAGLRAAAPDVGATAGRLGDAVAELRARLAGLHGCWGDDEPGRAFGSNYEPQAGELLSHLDLLVEALGKVPDGLEEMAANYAQAESDSTMQGR